MISRSVFFSLLTAVVISGCEDIEEMLRFSVNDQTTLRIESAFPLNLPLEIPTPDVTSNSQQQYENNNTSVDLVKDVRLEQLKLTITNPSAKTFSFLKSIKIYISTDEVNELSLATLENITTATNTIDLTVAKENLDKYIKASPYNLRTEVITRETLTESVDIKVDLKFRVTADAL